MVKKLIGRCILVLDFTVITSDELIINRVSANFSTKLRLTLEKAICISALIALLDISSGNPPPSGTGSHGTLNVALVRLLQLLDLILTTY